MQVESTRRRTRSRYTLFPIEHIKVPVQFGKKSRRKRRCRNLGMTGSLWKEPYLIENFYRIDTSERGAGRFICETRWHGDELMNIDKDGPVWTMMHYTTYKGLPQEIKDRIQGD